jgi:hypothetical protein
MPWADPARNAAAVVRWRQEHPGYWRRYERRPAAATVSRYAVLDEDLAQQRALYSLSRRRDEDPAVYRQRERRWIQATAFWSGDDDGSGTPRRRPGLDDEA